MSTLLSRLGLAGLLLPLFSISYSAKSQGSQLDKYIEEGLKNNLVLQQKDIALKKALYSLKTAESLFLPSINFQGSYQTGEGGRSIALPIGDLMNPVYRTLNQLTSASSEKFAPIQNVDQDFLPYNFYDAKLRATVPIINAALKYNRQIESQKAELQSYEVEIYKQELTKNIKLAYYNYLSALKAISIYESALVLANENRRTNERLLANGKGLPSYVLRSQSEIENIGAKITESKKAAENAALYFNFLLNRKSADGIDTAHNATKEFENAVALIAIDVDASKRTELKALEDVIDLHATVVKMNERFRTPKLNAFVDLGTQAQGFKFNGQSRYYFAGVQLDVPIFNGKRNLYKIQQSHLDKKNAEIDLDYTRQQLSLAASSAKNNLVSVYQSYQSSLKSLESALSYQRLIERGFREGINTFIEDIDARNLLTSAQLQVNINQYKVLIAAANLERETASLKQ